MSDEFIDKYTDIKPELVFQNFEDKVDDMKIIEEKKETVEEIELTEEEKKMVDQFVDKIEISNSNSILQYGVGAQKKISDFSQAALNEVRTKDLGEIGDILSRVVFQLKNFEDGEEKKGVFGFFKKGKESKKFLKNT